MSGSSRTAHRVSLAAQFLLVLAGAVAAIGNVQRSDWRGALADVLIVAVLVGPGIAIRFVANRRSKLSHPHPDSN